MGSQPSKFEGNYAVVMTGTAKAGEGDARRHPAAKDGLVSQLYDDVKTLYDGFQRGVKIAGDRPCLGKRKINADGSAGPFEWITYKQAADRATDFGSGLIKLGVDKHDADGNRVEWVIAEQGANSYSLVTVPLYDTLGPDAVEFVINQAGIPVMVCSNKEIKTALSVAQACKSLKFIVNMDNNTDESVVADGKAKGVEVLNFEDVEKSGKENPVEHRPPKPEDVATFCYTSGTTGNPKGAMETHGSIAADIAGVVKAGLTTNSTDVHLSYLPLAHMFERAVQAALYLEGASIGFFQGDTLKLLEDIKELRPTLFPSVPRLYNRIYDKIIQGATANGGLKKTLFEKAVAAKLHYLKQGYLEHKLWDKLVFSKVRARLGFDRVRMMITGSAPIAPHVMDFLRICFGCVVLEGYGQTECAAAATITHPYDFSSGHVGGPAPCNEIKLVDVEEMGYTSNDKPYPRGEVCFRGPNVFKGYYNDKEKTDEALDEDGWLHSGDIGVWLDNNALKIIDRKKNIFKLSQGEYVAAEKIENIYGRSNFVAQSFVYGDSLQSYLVGIVVPDEEFVTAWAKKQGIEGDFKALCANEALRKAVMDDMKKVGTESKLRGFEHVKNIFIHNDLFSPDNGLLTPTFKLKRNDAKLKFKKNIDDMYSENCTIPK